MSAQPLWRRTFDLVERPLGRYLEWAVQTDAFADWLALTTRVQRDLEREYREASERWLHLWNLPAYSDVIRVSSELAALQRKLREVTKQLEDERSD